jgi:hypothetical protein
MELIILTILTIGFVFLCSYTLRFQRVVSEIVLEISKNHDDTTLLDLQDTITPKSQSVRDILIYMLMISLFVLGIAFLGFYVTLAVLVFCLCLISPVLSTLMPMPERRYCLKVITKNLENRLEVYRKSGYASLKRLDSIENILKRLKNLNPDREYPPHKAKNCFTH